MTKATKIALIVFLLLIVAAVPLYYYTRPDAGQPASSLQLKGNVNSPKTLSLTELETMPSVTVQVTLSSSSHQEDNGVFNYKGVRLNDLLNQAQTNSNATSVFIQASDGYGTTITLQEAQNQNTIIAYQKDGAPLTVLKDGGEGPLRLIIGDDQYAQRWVRGVAAIDVT
ncbi:MAG: molybdopterin-dependent oxidoreductase [Candidatus Bathyarchaeota archaeon]|nr:molybdopterin-dependent oxidoreductase [Chloroflexota bacterium]MCL5876776.1 molybdopterin-dependent oxidoreductase [Candidatus Bathyarchaeota archaeon]